MASGKAAICMLPEPNVTSVLRENKEIRRALNLTTEWDKATEKSGEKSTLAQGCIIVNKEFAQKNKAAVDQFLTEYKASVDYVTESAVDASQLVEEFGIMPKALIAELAIPNCNIPRRGFHENDDAGKSERSLQSERKIHRRSNAW